MHTYTGTYMSRYKNAKKQWLSMLRCEPLNKRVWGLIPCHTLAGLQVATFSWAMSAIYSTTFPFPIILAKKTVANHAMECSSELESLGFYSLSLPGLAATYFWERFSVRRFRTCWQLAVLLMSRRFEPPCYPSPLLLQFHWHAVWLFKSGWALGSIPPAHHFWP